MGWGAAIGAGISAISSSNAADTAADAAESAAATEAAAIQAGIDEQARQFDYVQDVLEPYQGVGYNALYALSDMLGLPGYFGSNDNFTDFSGDPLSFEDWEAQVWDGGVDTEDDGVSGGSVQDQLDFMLTYGDLPQTYEEARDMWVTSSGDDESWVANDFVNLDDFWAAAQEVSNGASGDGMATDGGPTDQDAAYEEYLASFDRESYDWMTSPSYEFRLEEGLRALDVGAASVGNRLSGGRLLGLQEYGQQSASQEFEAQFNRLLSVAGLGSGATTVAAGAAGSTADATSQLLAAQGSALGAGTSLAGQYEAAGTINLGSALGGLATSIGSTYTGVSNDLDSLMSDNTLF